MCLWCGLQCRSLWHDVSTCLVSRRSGGSSVDRVRVPIDLRHLCSVGLAGGVARSVTHSLVLPLDVVKTRVQTDTALATAGIGAAAAAVLRDAPGRGVLRLAAFFNGLPPTAFGYLMQGCAKFGGWLAATWISEVCNMNVDQKWR